MASAIRRDEVGTPNQPRDIGAALVASRFESVMKDELAGRTSGLSVEIENEFLCPCPFCSVVYHGGCPSVVCKIP